MAILSNKVRKVGKKVVAGALALAMTVGMATSMPEMELNASAENTNMDSTVTYANETTQNILKTFGTLMSSNSSTSEYTSVKSQNIPDRLKTNYYSEYGTNYAAGYNFTMNNFDTMADQTLTIGTSSYSGTDTYTPEYKATSNAAVTSFSASSCYGDGFSSGTNKSYIGSVGTVNAKGNTQDSGSTKTDMDGTAYGILLKDSTYNTSSAATNNAISYRYNNVGSYTDDDGKTYDVDVVLKVNDYGVHDDYVALGANSQMQNRWSMVTQDDWNNLSSAQRDLLVTLTSSQQTRAKLLWNKDFKYAVPVYNYTAFTNTKNSSGETGWEILTYAYDTNRYSTKYGAVLTFTTDRVGLIVEWVDWIKVSYKFYKHGTDTALTVKGQTTWKDIDWSQGVSFYKDDIDDHTVLPYSWKSGNNLTQRQYYYTWGTHSEQMVGFFDYGYSKNIGTSDNEAWLAAKFNTSSFDVIYSFAGLFEGSTNAVSDYTSSSYYNSTTSKAVHALTGGTIQSDLPDATPTGTIRITKRFTINGGTTQYSTVDLVDKGLLTSTESKTDGRNNYIAGLTYKIKTSSGKYVVAKYSDNGVDYIYTGLTSSSSLATEFRLFYSSTSDDYRVILTKAPQGNYTVYEIIGTVTSSGKTSVVSNYIGRGTDEKTATVTNKNYLSTVNSSTVTASKNMSLASAPTVNTDGTIKSNGTLSGLYVRYTNNIDLYGTINVYKYIDKSILTSQTNANNIKFALYDETAGYYKTLTAGTSSYTISGSVNAQKTYAPLASTTTSGTTVYAFKITGLYASHTYRVEEVVTENSVYQTQMNYYYTNSSDSRLETGSISWKSTSGTKISNISISTSSSTLTTTPTNVYINNPTISNNKINIYKAVTGYTSNGTTSQTLLWNSANNITNMYNNQKKQVMSSADDANKLYYYVKNSSGQYLEFEAVGSTGKYEFKYTGTSGTLTDDCKIYFNSSMYGRNGGAATLTYLPDGTYYVYERYSGDALISSTPAYYSVSTTGPNSNAGGTTYSATSGATVSSLSGNTTKYVTFKNTVESETQIEITKYVKTGDETTLMKNGAAFGGNVYYLRFYLTIVSSSGTPQVLGVTTNSEGNYTIDFTSYAYQIPYDAINAVSVGDDGVYYSNYYGKDFNTLMKLNETTGSLIITVDDDLMSYINNGYTLYLHEVWYNPFTEEILGTSDKNVYSEINDTYANWATKGYLTNKSAAGTTYFNNVTLATEVGSNGYYGIPIASNEDQSAALNVQNNKITSAIVENYGPISLSLAKKIVTVNHNYDDNDNYLGTGTSFKYATSDNEPEVNSSLRFYIYNNTKGYYYKVKAVYDENGNLASYDLNGTSDSLTEDCYIKLTEDGNIVVNSVLNGTGVTASYVNGYYFANGASVTVYETFVDTDTDDDGVIDITAEYMNARYGHSATSTFTVSQTTYKKSLTFTNQYYPSPLTIVKNIEGYDELMKDVETDEEVIGTVAYRPEILDALSFYIMNSEGKYLRFEGNEFIGTTSTLTDDCYLKLESNGAVTVYHVPRGENLVVYEVCDNADVKALISTDKVVDFGEFTGGAPTNQNIPTVTFVDEPTTGKITVQKTTNLEGDEKVDLEGIEFEISGTSTLGFPVDEIITTDETGYAESGDIYVGNYIITEISAPNGLTTGGLVVNEKVLINNMGYYTDYEGNILAADNDGNLIVDAGEYTVAGDGDNLALATSGITVTTNTTASYTYYNYKSYMDVNIQKVTNSDDVDDPITDLSGITFTISGTSYVGIEVNESVTTGTDGLASFEHLPSGVYTVTEDLGSRADDFAGYADVGINGGQTWTITLDDENNGQTLDYEYWNYYTEISLTKLGHNAKGENEKLTGVTFSVFSDIDEDGEYDDSDDELLYYLDKDGDGSFDNRYDEVLTEEGFEALKTEEQDYYKENNLYHPLTLVEDPTDPGYYSIEGLPFGNYFVKETALGENEIRFGIEDTYFAVTISANETQIEIVTKDDEGYEEEAFIDPIVTVQSITLTKRIKVDEIDGSIWYEHGTPTFVLELTNTDDNITYRHSYEFTEDYVNANKFEENGVEYVEMSYTWDELPAAHYTATELNTTRYTLVDIINISDTGTKVEQTKTDDNVNTIWAVEFIAVEDSESYATFYNVKNTYKDLSDNCVIVNDII